jgi:hypothetical protein
LTSIAKERELDALHRVRLEQEELLPLLVSRHGQLGPHAPAKQVL